MGTIVYRFGLLPPIENGDLVREQMFAAHRYRNELVFIERQRRDAHRAILSSHGDVSAFEAAAKAADERCAEAARACAAARGKARTRKAPPELTRALSAAKAARKEAMKALMEARRLARVATDPQISELNDRAGDLRRGARALTTAFWGTYLQVEAAAEQSQKDMPLYEFGEPNDPRFVRWRNEGFVGVQLQGGLGVSSLDSDRRLQIVDAPPKPGSRSNPQSVRASRRRYCILSMRVGSEGRDPIWAKWPLLMHRQLPPDASIKWARVQMRRIGPREEWYLCLTVETNAPRRPVPESGAVSMDIGWRATHDGLRVGAWTGSDGDSGFALVPEKVPSGLELVQGLASRRDIAFNEAREKLAQWLQARRDPSTALPEDPLAGLDTAGPMKPGEVVWTTVPMQPRLTKAGSDGPASKDRPVLVMGQRGEKLVGVPLTSRGEHRKDCVAVGRGPWDPASRVSYAIVGQIIEVDPADVRRHGGTMDSQMFDRVVRAARRTATPWATSVAGSLPAWFIEATKTLSQWRSINRLAALVIRWKSNRFEGDEEIFDLCEAWRYRDFNAWHWQESQRTGTLRHRKDAYRVLASQLARRYRVLVLEKKLDLRTWAVKKDADGEEHLRYQRASAAPSEFREALINAFGGSGKGGRVVMVDMVNSTRECFTCGSIEEWDQAKELVHTCGSCGSKWDQDTNAANILLKRWREGEDDARTTGVARSDENGSDTTELRGGRWAKAKAKRRERVAEAAAARR